MITSTTSFNKLKKSAIAALTACALLTSCGDSESVAGIGGTGIVVGVITAFGSVYVNGIRFETTDSNFEVDGNVSASQSDLSIGMVVKIEGPIDSNGTSGTAQSIAYDDDIQGPIEQTPVEVNGSNGGQLTFSIFGQVVIVDKTTTQFKDTSFNSLQVNDILEVSGFRDSNSHINASFVKRTEVLEPGSSEVELKGSISQLSIVDQRFMIGPTIVFYNHQTEIETEGSTLANDLLVEVEGIYQADQSIFADEIELEEDLFEDDVEEISLQGIVSDFNSLSDFTLNGQAVNASNAEFSPENGAAAIENGSNIEVEGDIDDGILFAESVEIRGGEVEIQAQVSSVNVSQGSFELGFPNTVGTVTVITDGQTRFDDESESNANDFSINDLLVGDLVKVDGIGLTESVLASVVKRDDDEEEVKLQGTVNGFEENVFITVLGVNYDVSAGTDYDGFSSASDFFDSLSIGDLVELVDEEPADGIADEVSLDD
jgi:hypothetical protein